MKKFFLVAALLCVFNVATFAGWGNIMGYACNPQTSPANTCFYNEQPQGRNAGDDSMLTYINTLIAEYNPFVFFLK